MKLKYNAKDWTFMPLWLKYFVVCDVIIDIDIVYMFFFSFCRVGIILNVNNYASSSTVMRFQYLVGSLM